MERGKEIHNLYIKHQNNAGSCRLIRMYETSEFL